MFSTATIYHFRVYILQQKTPDVLRGLQKEGICQIKECEVDLKEGIELPYSEEIFSISNRLESIKHILYKFYPEETGANQLKGMFSSNEKPKETLEMQSNKEIVENSRASLKEIEESIFPKVERLENLEETLADSKEFLDRLWFFPEVNNNLFSNTKNLVCTLGFVEAKKVELLQEKIHGCIYAISDKGKNTKLIAVYHFENDTEKVITELHEVGFERFTIQTNESKNISKLISEKEVEVKKIETEIKTLKKDLAKWAVRCKDELCKLEAQIKGSKVRIAALKNFSPSRLFTVFDAWVPEKDQSKFIETMANTTEFYIESIEREDAPTIFDNPKLFRPFELLTTMFAPPKYKRTDPTPIVAIFFSLFFGFMLTDFFYGVLLAALGFGIYKGKGKTNETMKNFGLILVWAGVFTAVLGAMFGSYFGNILTNFGIFIPAIIDPMRDAVTVIGISIALAIIHLMIGLILGFKENLRLKRRAKALKDQGTWISLILGITALLLPIPFSFEIGLSLIILSIVLLIVFTAKTDGPIVAALSIFDFPGFLGDVFSYTRLTAMAIATAGIALAVNFLVQLGGGIPLIGPIAAIIIFLIGHTFNFVMNFLGSFIHSMRLHFLEFFKKFYEGGGKLYEPFKLEDI